MTPIVTGKPRQSHKESHPSLCPLAEGQAPHPRRPTHHTFLRTTAHISTRVIHGCPEGQDLPFCSPSCVPRPPPLNTRGHPLPLSTHIRASVSEKEPSRAPKHLESPWWPLKVKERPSFKSPVTPALPDDHKITLFFTKASLGRVFCHTQLKEICHRVTGSPRNEGQAQQGLRPPAL